MPFFVWDEISDEITSIPDRQRCLWTENTDWKYDTTLPNGTIRRKSERGHVSLEASALFRDSAFWMFMADPTFKEMHDAGD